MTQVTSQALQKVRKGTAEKVIPQMTARKLQGTVQTWRRSFQTRAAATGQADSHQPCTMNDQWWWWRWAKTTSSLEVPRPEGLVSDLWWCCTMQTFERGDSEFVIVWESRTVGKEDKKEHKKAYTILLAVWQWQPKVAQIHVHDH